jgi:hypothetical protein
MMVEPKFTPGPWEVHGPTEEPSAAKRVFAGTTYLGTVTNSDMSPEEIAANAELWADAPRMLGLLRVIHDLGIPLEHGEKAKKARAVFWATKDLLEKHGG